MGLFHRRPLCLFCFLFLLSSIFAISVDHKLKLVAFCVVTVVIFSLILLALLFKRGRMILVSVMLCCVAVVCGFANTLYRIDAKQMSAESYVGFRTIEMDVLGVEYTSAYSSTYDVKIRNIDGEMTSIRSLAVFSYPSDYCVGDKIFVNAEIRVNDQSEQLLVASVDSSVPCYLQKFDQDLPVYKMLFAKNGVRVMLDRVKTWVSERIYALLGDKDGALAKAFLMGDKSGLSTSLIRDFRRTGVSHLFAVSGLHITIIAGAAELLLRKLYIPRALRGVSLSILAFALLCLAGFSMSAMRSVLMFWIAYVLYLLSEENDSPTTLFVAVAIIIAMFPFAVYEIGLWMSFLATLGLITVYPVFEAKIPRASKQKSILAFVQKCGRSLLLVAIMTVVSTMFLLPISWYVFGELSLVSVIVNVILSPINAVYLVLLLVLLIVGNIPFISVVLAWVIQGLSTAVVAVIEGFSSVDGATVSLRYPFAKYIIIAFVLVSCVMLIVKFKRKWLLAIPAASLVLSFAGCVTIYYATQNTSVFYYGYGTSEVLSVCDDGALGLVDMTNGRYSLVSDAITDARERGATDVDTIVFTNVTSSHLSSMDYVFRNNLIKRIYVPLTDGEYDNAYELVKMAQECGIEAELYADGDTLVVCRENGALIRLADNQDRQTVAVVIAADGQLSGYVDAYAYGSKIEPTVNEYLPLCRTVIIGNNGIPDNKYKYEIADGTTLIYASERLAQMSEIDSSDKRVFYNYKDSVKIEILQ